MRRSPVTPNHITSASLVAGLGAAALLATGDPGLADWGAGLFVLSAILDHCDGELARLSGRTSAFGRHYDNAADLVKLVAVFACMGLGLRETWLGGAALGLGVAAAAAVSVIFTLEMMQSGRRGAPPPPQPAFAGFEIEDILYLVGPVTWMGGLPLFQVAAGLGAPVFALWEGWRFWRSRGSETAP